MKSLNGTGKLESDYAHFVRLFLARSLFCLAVSLVAAVHSAAQSTTTGRDEPQTDSAIPATFFAMSAVRGDYPMVTIGTLAHQEFAWGRIEKSKGNFDFSLFDAYMADAQQHGLVDAATNTANFAMTLAAGTPGWAVADQSTCGAGGDGAVICTAAPDNIQDWKDFLEALIQHYNGKTQPHIKYYELWNEFNVSLWWTGTDIQMVALGQAAYPIIHQDPNSMLLTPSVAGPVGTVSPNSGVTAMTGYLQAGGSQYADGGAFHGYIGAQKGVDPFPMPEDDSTVACKPFVSCYGSIITKATQMRAAFDQNGLAGKPMFQTEGSWGNSTVTDPDTQVAWVSRYNLLQAGLRSTLNLQMAAWFTWANPTFGWGNLADSSLNPTAAGLAYSQVYNWVAGSSIGEPCSGGEDGTWTCTLTRPGGYMAHAVWNTQGTATYTPGQGYRQYRDLAGNTTPIQSGASVTIGPKPILVELIPDTLAIEVAKQKGSGKLIVYATSTDPSATLSLAAFPQPPEVMPIILGNMAKTSPGGNESFLVKKGLPPIQSIQISSTSGGSLTETVKQPH